MAVSMPEIPAPMQITLMGRSSSMDFWLGVDQSVCDSLAAIIVLGESDGIRSYSDNFLCFLE